MSALACQWRDGKPTEPRIAALRLPGPRVFETRAEQCCRTDVARKPQRSYRDRDTRETYHGRLEIEGAKDRKSDRCRVGESGGREYIYTKTTKFERPPRYSGRPFDFLLFLFVFEFGRRSERDSGKRRQSCGKNTRKRAKPPPWRNPRDGELLSRAECLKNRFDIFLGHRNHGRHGT